MLRYCVKPSKVSGTIAVPPSKSQTLRAILFGSFGKGKSIVSHYLHSPDAKAMIAACRAFGAHIDESGDQLVIHGNGGRVACPDQVIDAGNSGIVLRFASAVAALSGQYTVVTGDHSVRSNRPIQPLLDGLNHLGAHAISTRNNGFAPIIIRGPLKAGSTTLSGEDSQPVSALLIAASFIDGPVEIHVRNPGEKPWVEMTLSWLTKLGISYTNHDYAHYKLRGGAIYEGFHYTVPGDLSSAAFPIAAAVATGSQLTVHNVDLTDCQGDKQVITILQQMGATIHVDTHSRTLFVDKRTTPLKGVDVDINDFIDGIAILAVMGCLAEGTTLLRNGAIARTKECDRIACLTTELKKMGADIEEMPDGLRINGSALHGAQVHSHHDHRMAMALTVAALTAHGESVIEDVQCVEKTFPNFKSEFNAIGADIQ